MTYREESDDWDRGDAPEITPPDPERGICPACGMWAKLPVADLTDAARRMADQYVAVGQVLADTMHAAQIAALGRAGDAPPSPIAPR